MGGDPLDERVLQAFVDREFAPLFGFPGYCGTISPIAVGNREQVLRCLWRPVQNDVFDRIAELGWQVGIHRQLSGVDNAHREAGANGVIEKYAVDGFPHRVVAAKRKRHVADAARYVGARQVLADPARALDEIHGVVVVLFDTGDRKSTRLNSSHVAISYAVFCLKKKKSKILTFYTSIIRS